jgi:hypothetical protein
MCFGTKISNLGDDVLFVLEEQRDLAAKIGNVVRVGAKESQDFVLLMHVRRGHAARGFLLGPWPDPDAFDVIASRQDLVVEP